MHACDFTEELEEIDHTLTLAITADRLQQIKHVSSNDPVMKALRETILHGWPDTKSDVLECVHPYLEFQDELTVQDELVFKGTQLVIPTAMREEMMAMAHASHIGVEGCTRRARETFWPRMSVELKVYISKCDICMAYRSTPVKEPIVQHNFAACPWSKVGADLCELQGHTLLIVSDYHSDFIEVKNITQANTATVSKALKAMPCHVCQIWCA